MGKPQEFIPKRRIYFIEKEFQTKFMLKFFSLVAIGGLITVGALYLATMQSNTVAFVDSRVVVKTTADFLLPLAIQTVIIVTVIVSIAALVVTLFVSHKIAGPLYRLKKVMASLEKGDFSGDFRLRHYDQLQDIAGAFNSMIVNTKERLKVLQGLSNLLREDLVGISATDITEKARPKIDELKRTLAELDKTLSHFKV